jgi:hypothetical protein
MTPQRIPKGSEANKILQNALEMYLLNSPFPDAEFPPLAVDFAGQTRTFLVDTPTVQT